MPHLYPSFLLHNHDAFDAGGAAGALVAVNPDAAEARVALCRFPAHGHAGEEALQHQILFDADHAVVGAGHANVGDVGRAFGQNALVGRGDVRVGAEDGGDAAVEIPADGDFFRRGLGVHIENDYLGGEFVQNFVGLAEGVVVAGHEDAALQVDDGEGCAAPRFAFEDAPAGRAGGIVGGTQDALGVLLEVVGAELEVLDDLALVPNVVAGGEDVDAELEELVGDGWGD